MRWDDLFADLEGQLASAGRLDQEAQVAELVRAEQGAVGLADRLRGHGARPIDALLKGGVRLRGRIRQVADTWLAMETAQHSVLVPLDALVTVAGLGREVRSEGSAVRRTASLASRLRMLARDRAAVTCLLDAGRDEAQTIVGTVDTVGSDYLEVRPVRGEFGPTADGAMVVPFGALVAVRSGS